MGLIPKQKKEEVKKEVEEVKEEEDSQLTREELVDVINGNLNRTFQLLQLLR